MCTYVSSIANCLVLDEVPVWKVSACLVAALWDIGILHCQTLLDDQTFNPDPESSSLHLMRNQYLITVTKLLRMTSLSAMHRPSLIQPSLHVCALSPSNTVNLVYYQESRTPGSSEYTFQIFTPAISDTYGLQATDKETIFEVSQLWGYCNSRSLQPLQLHGWECGLVHLNLFQMDCPSCCAHMRILIWIKYGLNPDSRSELTCSCKRDFRNYIGKT